MKLNRVLSAIVLTGLLGGAGMAAQAQTRLVVRIGTPAVAMVASYIPPSPGPGYVWEAGYYDGPQWIPGQWVYRVDSRYRRDGYSYGRYAQLNQDRRDGQDRNFRGRDQNRNGYNVRNDRNGGDHGRDNRGGRH
jgi:hypothetical protein